MLADVRLVIDSRVGCRRLQSTKDTHMALGTVGSLMVWLAAAATTQARQPVNLRAQPPEIPHESEADWINSKPLKFADLKGKVVVVNFWTFG
jgi:hypothetical protein